MGKNEELFEHAQQVIPGGVNSPVRAYGSVGGAPRFIQSASGSTVTDASGRSYIDLVASWGPALLGHAHPDVVAVVQQAATRGLSFGAPTQAEVDLADVVIARVRAGSVAPLERVRLVSTGTEATMTAIRLARGVTGRDLLVKFAGHYHGHSDGLLAAAGSGVATLSLPGSAGVPASVVANTLVIEYNNPAALAAVFAEHGSRIAAIIVEAAGANMGVVPPQPGFNTLIAETAHEHGALMILDEVLTGFRVHPAGYWGLQQDAGELYEPDLFTFGKVIGGGMPLAALAGRAAVMDQLAPVGPVYQAGTLSGNPLSVAAGIATLQAATADVYARVDTVASRMAAALEDAAATAGVTVSVSRAGNLFGIAFAAAAPQNYAEALAQESWRYPAFFHAMLDAGFNLPPSVFEAFFATAAHTDADIAAFEAALPGAFAAAAEAVPAD